MNTEARPAAVGVTPESVDKFLLETWPMMPMRPTCLDVTGRSATADLEVPPESLRPGGFISGPTQFGMADVLLWIACFGAVGLEAMALTSELSIRFLRPAQGHRLTGRAQLDSIGSRKLVGSVSVWTDDSDRPVSVAQGTYMLPTSSDPVIRP